MSDSDGETVSIDDLRAGDAEDSLAEADVVIAVDATSDEEEVVYGRHEWDIASASGREADLMVLRVELDLEAGDLEWLVEMVEAIKSGEADEVGDTLGVDDDD